ncbi:hypothetical protein [Neisseria lactamica]|nr:hypothetical protein [Neisseria lactamica]
MVGKHEFSYDPQCYFTRILKSFFILLHNRILNLLH